MKLAVLCGRHIEIENVCALFVNVKSAVAHRHNADVVYLALGKCGVRAERLYRYFHCFSRGKDLRKYIVIQKFCFHKKAPL
jgi:hypothetical protein